MTRINCVPVQELTREHLVAEYRELPRLAAFAASKYARNPGFVPPPTYRLGKGHMDFFVDKGQWLADRHAQLVEEMRRRGYQVNFPDYPRDKHPQAWMGGWQPNEVDMAINRDRIAERLSA
jgi:deoxyribonuclease (pyrimidine dimer)